MTQLLSTLSDYRNDLQYVALIGVAVAALRWGAGPERASALALLYLLIADFAYHAIFGPGIELRSLDVGHAMIDLTAMLGFAAIGLTANRMYTLWMGALQIIAVQAHVARELQESISPLAYVVMYSAPSYFQIVLLAFGTLAHRRRLRAYGKYKSWRIAWPPSWAPRRIASLLD